jgi:hypothetical protein
MGYPNLNNKKYGLTLLCSNYFSALAFEPIEDDNKEDIVASEIGLLTVPGKNKLAQQKKETCAVYELEEDYQSELVFKIFCFFEDLHTLQGEVRRMWKAHNSGNLDLLSATIVTTAAINLVSCAEKDIQWTHPGVFNTTRSYQDLALTIFYSESLRHGEDPDEHIDSDEALDLEITPFKEFIYLPTGRTLMKIAQMRHIFEKGAYPIPIPPMRFSYIARPEFLESPWMRKFEAEDETICQLIQDLSLQEDLKTGWDGVGKGKKEMLQWKLMPLFDDAFTGAMRKVWKDGEITVQSVFAARILLDILDICGPNFKGQKLLIDEGNRAQSIFLFTNDNGVLDTEDGVRWLRKDQDLIQGIYSRITLHMLEPTFPSFKQFMLARNPEPPDIVPPCREELERMGDRCLQVTIGPSLRERKDADHEISPTKNKQYEENYKKLNPKPIRPNRDPNFTTNRNPLYCGTVLLNLAAMTEEAGVALANHHLSIFAAAHLYNAWRQMDLTRIRWPEMDKIIENHIGPIFAGDIPTTPEAMLSRMSYRLGMLSNSKLYDKKNPWKIHSTPVTRTLMQFFESKEPLERTLHQLEEQIHTKEQSLVTRRQSNSQVSQQKTNSRRHLTPLQFISKLEKYIPNVLPDMNIDYITLTKTCNELLRCIRTALRRKLNVRYDSQQTPGDSNDHGLSLMVLAIVLENGNAATSTLRGETFGGGPQLRVAWEMFEEFWRKENVLAAEGGLVGIEEEAYSVL